MVYLEKLNKIMKYTELKKERSSRFSKLCNDVGLFWAFDDNQLEEGMKKLNCKKSDLINYQMGGILLKKNVKMFIKEDKKINTWFKKEFKKCDLNKVIRYELNNYECYYTGETTDAYEALKYLGITKDQINKVFRNKNYNFNKGK